jgi:hypothetical protein
VSEKPTKKHNWQKKKKKNVKKKKKWQKNEKTDSNNSHLVLDTTNVSRQSVDVSLQHIHIFITYAMRRRSEWCCVRASADCNDKNRKKKKNIRQSCVARASSGGVTPLTEDLVLNLGRFLPWFRQVGEVLLCSERIGDVRLVWWRTNDTTPQ